MNKTTIKNRVIELATKLDSAFKNNDMETFNTLMGIILSENLMNKVTHYRNNKLNKKQ